MRKGRQSVQPLRPDVRDGCAPCKGGSFQRAREDPSKLALAMNGRTCVDQSGQPRMTCINPVASFLPQPCDRFSSAAKPPYWILGIVLGFRECRFRLALGRGSSFGKSEIMMRAALILVGLGTLVVLEREAPPRTRKAVNEPLRQSTVGLSASRDTLTKADRLAIPYVQNGAPAQRISSVERMPPPDPKAVIPQEVPKIVDQQRRGAVVVVLPGPRPKHTASGKTATIGRSKVAIAAKLCRPNTFDSLLKALSLSPACET
jgi:hypothetical protein